MPDGGGRRGTDRSREGGGGGGLRERGNDTSKSTGRSGRQNAATRRNMRREERVTVQGPIKEQQPNGPSHMGGGGVTRRKHSHGPRRWCRPARVLMRPSACGGAGPTDTCRRALCVKSTVSTAGGGGAQLTGRTPI